MLVRSLFMKNRKKTLAHDVMYASATCASLVHDITDLVKMAALTAIFLQLSNVDF